MPGREVIGRTPNSSYFSLSDWKGCAVTGYGTTEKRCVGETERMEAAQITSHGPAVS